MNIKLIAALNSIKINPYFYKLHGSKAAEIMAVCALDSSIFNQFILKLKAKLSTLLNKKSYSDMSVIISNLEKIHILASSREDREYIIKEANDWASNLAYKQAAREAFLTPDHETKQDSISSEIEDGCTKLQFYLSNSKTGGAEIIYSCILSNEREEIFIKLCDSLEKHAKNQNEVQYNIAKQVIEILRFLRVQANNDKKIQDYITKRVIEAAELVSISNYIERGINGS